MKRMRCLIALFLVAGAPYAQEERLVTEKVEFPAPDDILITADLYQASEDKQTPFIVLFHQARSSRGEYRGIGPRLKALGFNALAVDLRAGARSGVVKNATARRHANVNGKAGTYLDALQDVVAALEHVRAEYASGKVLAWGSSYSASLVLYVAGTKPELVDGVLSFAPGEYFQNLGKPATWVQEAAATIRCPVFITGARNEKKQWEPIFAAIPTEEKEGFVPKGSGKHGSSALWEETAGNAEYWAAVEGFLDEYFPRAKKD